MQAAPVAGRRLRATCPRCGRLIDLARLRSHLRDEHQVGSTELEARFLAARREVRRANRSARR